MALEDRVTELERRLDNLTKWVVYFDGNEYKYCNLGYAERYSISYEPTLYDCAEDARHAARTMH